MATIGVRLYPMTQDSSILERLAGVPHGTAINLTCGGSQSVLDRLYGTWGQLIQIGEHQSHYGCVIHEAIQGATKQLNDERDYMDFLKFGFGRLVIGHDSTKFWKSIGLDILGGETDDPVLVRAIAGRNHVDGESIELLVESGGIRWRQ